MSAHAQMTLRLFGKHLREDSARNALGLAAQPSVHCFNEPVLRLAMSWPKLPMGLRYR